MIKPDTRPFHIRCADAKWLKHIEDVKKELAVILEQLQDNSINTTADKLKAVITKLGDTKWQ